MLDSLRTADREVSAISSSEKGETDRSHWTRIITPERGWFHINFRELWRYRDLVVLFVWRDFVATYKQTILGPAWFFISPLMTAVVFTVVFGKIARIPTDGMPPFLFYLSGTVCWGYFARCIGETSHVFSANIHLFGKVYFPRLSIPFASVLSSGIRFLIQFSILLGFIFYFFAKGAPIRANIWSTAVPLFALQAGVLGMAAGIVISSLTTKYRDLNHFVHFGVQLWMYATPVVYPLSQIPDRYRPLCLVNPMVPVVEAFRKGLLGTGTVTPGQMAVSILLTLLLLLAGLMLFTRTENTFMDRV